jgi:hypothetical protein
MQKVIIPATDRTPEISLDKESRIFQFKGRCLPENIRTFGENVMASLDGFLARCLDDRRNASAGSLHKVIFRFGYFNSAAARLLADILSSLGKAREKGCLIKIYWYFEEEDHDMLEAGEDISEMVGVPMEFVAVVKDEE